MNTIVTEISKAISVAAKDAGAEYKGTKLVPLTQKDFCAAEKMKGGDGLRGRAAKRAYREYFRKTVIAQTEAFKSKLGTELWVGAAVGSEKGAVVLRTMDKAAFEKKTELKAIIKAVTTPRVFKPAPMIRGLSGKLDNNELAAMVNELALLLAERKAA